MKSRTFVAAFLTFAIAAAAGAQPVPAEIPVETLFETPSMSALEFSPNGKAILALMPYQRRQNLVVIDLVKGTKNLLTNFKDRQASAPMWANDNRILYRVDDDGKESFSLYAVNRDGSDPAILASGYSKAGTLGEFNSRFRSLFKRSRKDPKSIFVLANITNSDWTDVARMNLRTGEMFVVARAPGNAAEYLMDHNDEVRFAVVQDTQQIRRVLYREGNGQEWTEVASHHADESGWEPIAFEGDNRTVYVLSSIGRKTAALYRYDTKTQAMGEMVFGDDTYDLTATYGDAQKVYFDESKNKVVGFGYEADRTRFHWLDAEFEQLSRKMNTALPDTVHRPFQISQDGSRVLFMSSSDRDPGVYYLYDRVKQTTTELAVVAPKIDPGQMAHTKPMTYQARDGLTLHGYLTLPVGIEAKNLPLILHPHGGPYTVRDHWRFDPEVQFYANRGFAVLQVDYRGSGGYGAWFDAAGHKKWGLEMQDDLSDGVKWLINQGIVNPRRVVISGASYGGYATMAGLVFTPELYCAGINYVGVVDIEDLLPRGLSASRAYWFHTRIGDMNKAEDRKRIHDTSPVHFSERIRVPLLMAYGKNDPRVPIDQAYDIERALKKADRPYELIIEEDEGHGFRKEEKRIAFYTRIEAFLKKYVLSPGRRENVEIAPLKILEMPAKNGSN